MSSSDVSNTPPEEITIDLKNQINHRDSCSHSSKRFRSNETATDCNHYWNQYYVTEDDVQYSDKDLRLFKVIITKTNHLKPYYNIIVI